MIRMKITKDCDTVLIEDGYAIIFNRAGRYSSETQDILPSYVNGNVKVQVISVLSTLHSMDILVKDDNIQKRYSTPLDSTDCIMRLTTAGGFIKTLRRTGNIDGAKYSQLLFVYTEDADLGAILKELQVKEID